MFSLEVAHQLCHWVSYIIINIKLRYYVIPTGYHKLSKSNMWLNWLKIKFCSLKKCPSYCVTHIVYLCKGIYNITISEKVDIYISMIFVCIIVASVIVYLCSSNIKPVDACKIKWHAYYSCMNKNNEKKSVINNINTLITFACMILLSKWVQRTAAFYR